MSHLIGRRQFLVVSTATAVATAAVGPQVLASAVAAPPRRLSVGFAPPEEGSSLIAATGIRSADGRFLDRGARISVSGASGTPVSPQARRAVELVAQFPHADGTMPFTVWGCSRTTGCQGSPTRFTFPVAEEQKIVFTVETERGTPLTAASRRDALKGAATESTRLPVTLTLGSESNALRLARGFYVIVPIFEHDAEPSWRAYTLRTADGRWALHDRSGRIAPFEHFVLRVDYAKA